MCTKNTLVHFLTNMLVGYGYGSDEEEENQQPDDSVVMGELHVAPKRKAPTTAFVPKILLDSYTDLDDDHSYQANKRFKSGKETLSDVLPKPKNNPVNDEENSENSSEEEEDIIQQKTSSESLSLADLGLAPREPTNTQPQEEKVQQPTSVPSPAPEPTLEPAPGPAPGPALGPAPGPAPGPALGPEVGPSLPTDFGGGEYGYSAYEEVDPYPSYSAYEPASSQSRPSNFVPYAPAPPPLTHIMGSRATSKWGEGHMVSLPDDGEFIDVSATALHNRSFTRTELAQKKRLEILSGKIPSALSNKKGQLSALILEAERTALLQEENKERQRALKRETKKKYCW
eukprot:TRINITY_DN17301_c0_g1_i1.p1 TRINITY_DN17301_c0_g1~~TRINITY_DN17301_c0_g1_i1.p1  ORF type:complete len:342 (-),score=94.93 TRINITY_DN17301_c0_g1_i1:38-1063(-)